MSDTVTRRTRAHVEADRSARLKAKRDKEDAKRAKLDAQLSKRLERERKKQERENKKAQILFKREQRLKKRTHLFDDVSVTVIKKSRKDGRLPKGSHWLGKECINFLVINPENPMQAVLRVVDGTNWRNGLWFYDFDEMIHMKFEKQIHKPGYGDVSITWLEFNDYIDKVSKEPAA